MSPLAMLLIDSKEVELTVDIKRIGLRWKAAVYEYELHNGQLFGWRVTAWTRHRVIMKALDLMEEIYKFRDARDARNVDTG